MKFAVVVASRNRPREAVTVLTAARMLASGEHPIEYLLAIDDDDPQRNAYHQLARLHKVDIYPAPRPPGPGACWNRCVPKTEADVIVALTDDGLIASLFWDQLAADYFKSLKHHELGVLALNDLANQGQATIIMAHRKWIALQPDAKFFDDRFPFWFSDTALAETYAMATGYNMPLHEGIVIANKPGRFNPRIRDMDLWWDLYAATRTERIATAARIRQRLQLRDVDVDGFVKLFEARDATARPAAHDIVASIVNPAPITVEYERACEQAKAYLIAHRHHADL